MLAAAAVEPVGDIAFAGRVLLHVGVEQEQRDAADLGLPDAGVERAAAGKVQYHLTRCSVGLAQQGERQFVRVEDGIVLLLPAFARQALAEVAVPVEQPHPDEGYAQVAGGLQMVPGKDAESAGVLGKGCGHAELGREVRHGGRQFRALRLLLLVPPRTVQILLEGAGHLVEPVQELLVPGQLGEPPGGDGAEQTYRVGVRRPAALRGDGLEELTCLGVPGPAQVAGEVAERLKGVGEDGTHGESTNGLHVFHLYRGRTNPRGRTTVCALSVTLDGSGAPYCETTARDRLTPGDAR